VGHAKLHPFVYDYSHLPNLSATLLTGQREQSQRRRSQVRLASSNLAVSRTTSSLQ